MIARIPQLRGVSVFAMRQWFGAMSHAGLLFHPDSAAEELVDNDSGERFFSPEECIEIDSIMDKLFAHQGDKVYDAVVYQLQKKQAMPYPN